MYKYELVKVKGKAIWINQGEWESERLTVTKNGEARLVTENCGWNGCHDVRTYVPDPPKELTLHEAISLLETWGADDSDIAKVRVFEPYMAASL